MRDILMRLRTDAGQMTLAVLIQEREAAACEIEQLREQLRQRSREPMTPKPIVLSTVVTRREPQIEPRAFPPNALLRLSEVCKLVAVSRSTVYNWVSHGAFPRPIRISRRSVRWRFEHIAQWIRNPIQGT